MVNTLLKDSSPSLPLPTMPPHPVTPAYTLSLPKLELHAHLTGSITPLTLHEIWLLHPPTSPPLEDPLHKLSRTATWSLQTFFPLFTTYTYALLRTRESVLYATDAVLTDFKNDGVVYLELRTTPRASEVMSKREYVETVLDAMAAFPGRGAMRTFLILSIDRRDTAEEGMAVVELAQRLKHRGVVGVDLCGDPRVGDVSTFADAFREAKAGGLGVTVHFGEVRGAVEGGEGEALLGFGPGRVGHVVHVREGVREEVLRRGLGVELCVSCNVQAGLTEGGVGGHHFGWWWERGGKVVLCVSLPFMFDSEKWADAGCFPMQTDDVGVFGSTLSNEYLLVAEHFNLSRRDLLELCGRGIETIFGGEGEKSRLRGLMTGWRDEDGMVP